MEIAWLIGMYLVFQTLTGLFVCGPIYYSTERSLTNWREFLYAILFPLAGFGTWVYNRKKRILGSAELPVDYYIWKKATLINLGFILFLVIYGLVIMNSITPDLSKDHPRSEYVDILTGGIELMFEGIGFLFAALIGIIGFGFLFVLLVLIPRMMYKSIETNHYKKLAKAKKNN